MDEDDIVGSSLGQLNRLHGGRNGGSGDEGADR